MSTKSSFYLDNDFHFYREGFDDENVYLALDRSIGAVDQLVIKIPLRVWMEMRKHTIEPAEQYLSLTDEEFLAEAERQVDEHRAWLESEPDSPLKGMSGLLLFGSQGSTRAEMIERFVLNYRSQLVQMLRGRNPS